MHLIFKYWRYVLYFQVDVHAGFLHDAVLMWAYGLNATLEAGGNDTQDGQAISQHIFNRTIEGKYMSVTIFVEVLFANLLPSAVVPGNFWTLEMFISNLVILKHCPTTGC